MIKCLVYNMYIMKQLYEICDKMHRISEISVIIIWY